MTDLPPDRPEPGVVAALDAELDRVGRRVVRLLGAPHAGLPMAQQRMAALLRGAQPRIAELAAALDVHVSTASKGVDLLCQAGLAAKVRDGSDSRSVRVHLTSIGRSVTDAATSSRRRGLAGALGTWTDADKRALLRYLRAINTDTPPSRS